MSNRLFWSRVSGAGVGLCLAISISQAQPQIPALPEIDDALAAAHPELVKKRAGLIAERKKLLDQTNRHNAKCSAVTEGSTAEKDCLAAYGKLDAAINQHIGASKAYILDYDTTRKAGPSKAVRAHTDTSVVDARNVPSGLPLSVQKAIDDAYAKSPPGVRERVRKGFQAVMDRHWKVAKAWFQDALNHDPTNADLRRLVAISDTPPASTRAKPAPKHTLASLSANADEMSTAEVMAALETILEEQFFIDSTR